MKKLAVIAACLAVLAGAALARPMPKGKTLVVPTNDYRVNVRMAPTGGSYTASPNTITLTPDDECLVEFGVRSGSQWTGAPSQAAGDSTSVEATVPLNANQPNVFDVNCDYIRFVNSVGVSVKIVVEY